MAFDYTNLYPDTASNGSLTKTWNYTTLDSSATVSASGYFNKVYNRLGVGDIIFSSSVNSFDARVRTTVTSAILLVTGISGQVVTTEAVVASGGSGGTPHAPVNSVQFNDAGAFGGNAGFTYDRTTALNVILTNAGSTSAGATATITAGDGGATSGNGGLVALQAGNAVGAGYGGDIQLVAGEAAGNASQQGGTISLDGGAADLDGNGGEVNITGGRGGSTNGTGGTVSLIAGSANGGGDGGEVIVTSGDGEAAFNGGNIEITGGVGGATGNGAPILITAGRGGSTSGNGGAVSITSGNGRAGNGNGGAVTITAGTKDGSGADGDISLQPGTAGFVKLVNESNGQLSTLIRQVSKSAAYTTILTDSGKHILHPTADNNARTFTIDSNANVAYPIGTAITFVNQINTVTIAITSDTLILAGTGTAGSRTLAANGVCTALKIASTTWIISGTGLT